MASARIGRLIALNSLILLCHSQEYRIPPVRIQAFRPKGFRATIDDAPNLALFTFQGNVNRAIGSSDVGDISGEVTEATNGRWVVEDQNVVLKVGDVIKYHVFAAVSSKGYVADGLSFTVNELEDYASTPGSTAPDTTRPVTSSPGVCRPTQTLVRGGSACAGQVIFEDTFDSLRENVWQVEQYIPMAGESPEYPFNSYQRLANNPTVSVANGHLSIKPTLQQNLPGFSTETIYSGTLNLFSGCTAPAEACVVSASGADIIPPVASGRVTSKGFAFTYGTVEVRAKLPQGDWLYPEILLEPFMKKYGSKRYASGVLKIASARGNSQLNAGTSDYSNKVLYGGPVLDFQCHDTLLSKKARSDGKQWGDDYHVFAVRWAPDRITLSVDGEEWARVDPSASGLVGRLPRGCDEVPRTLLAMGARIAPFDDHFYLTLGVSAGSVTEFPDGLTTGDGRPKPWSNHGRKAALFFWQDIDAWSPTWQRPELSVDYIKADWRVQYETLIHGKTLLPIFRRYPLEDSYCSYGQEEGLFLLPAAHGTLSATVGTTIFIYQLRVVSQP